MHAYRDKMEGGPRANKPTMCTGIYEKRSDCPPHPTPFSKLELRPGIHVKYK